MPNWSVKVFSEFLHKAVDSHLEMFAMKGAYLHREIDFWKETSAPNGVVIYGAGGMGRVVFDALRKLGVCVNAFIDMDRTKQGGFIGGDIPVFSMTKAGARFNECPCIIAINMLERQQEMFSISSALCSHGFKRVLHHQFLRRYMSIIGFTLLDNYKLHSSDDVIASHNEILHVSELLYDDFSREVLFKIIRSRLFDPNIPMECWRQVEGVYFPDGVFRILPDEVVIDGGAYDGDTLRAFHARYPGGFKAWYAYEPLQQNIAKIDELRKTFPSNLARKIHLRPLALGNGGDSAVFLTNNLSAHGGKVVESADSGFDTSLGIPSDILTVPACRIDDEHYEDEPTFIKLDVEGAETDVLEGAERTICSTKPLVAASLYHRSKDLWTIPLLLHRYMPDARFIIRANQPLYDTVLYVVPVSRWL